MPPRKTICFVTGTRAEFGLMRTALLAIGKSPRLKLQIVVTGMHLAAAHGRSIDRIRAEGWRVNAVVPWQGSPAAATGKAIATLAAVFKRLKPDVVLIVGDRVEALAAATAAHLSGIVVAHVHGGDRALGQVDDCLRHAITKMAHIHFPATKQSAQRLIRLGEDAWRVWRVGSPAIDGITKAAAPRRAMAKKFPRLAPERYALLMLHPVDGDEKWEYARASETIVALVTAKIDRIIMIYPNNDPGCGGIIRAWESIAKGARFLHFRDLPRNLYLGLLRDAAMVVGNSSSGIIEAGSFGTPVIDIGPRQLGRERSARVRHVDYNQLQITRAARSIWNGGWPRRQQPSNSYGPQGAGAKIAMNLTKLAINQRILRKIIAY